MLSAGLSSSLSAPAPARAGVVVAIGGALKHDNDAVWQRLVLEAGGPGSRFAVFATAAQSPARAGERVAATLRRAGAVAEVIPVAPKLKDLDWRAQRDDAALIERVGSAQAVFFSGGDQGLILEALRPDEAQGGDGRETAMLGAIRQVFARGGMVAGTSAGAAIMSEWMFRDALDALAVLKGRLRLGREIDRGFGFAPPGLFIDQHFLKRGRIGRLLPAMVATDCRLGLGVEENSAALIRDGEIEIIGARGALLVDLSQAASATEGGAFRLKGAALSFLDRGDRHSLRSGQSSPAADKLRGRIDPNAPDFKPYHERTSFFPDMLGDNTIANAMAQLIDSPDAELRGLAFNGKALLNRQAAAAPLRDDKPDLGFEFRLYKGPDSLGFHTGAWGGDDLTVLRLYLDVNPVRLASPLYSPWATL